MTRSRAPTAVPAGLYAVLDRDDAALARALLDGGARTIQLRIKSAAGAGPSVGPGAGELLRIARWLRALCDTAGAVLIVNDRLDVALAAGADGVHLGQTDLPLAAARAAADDRLWIGVSTHTPAQVAAAVAGGASYLGYGPVFATQTKQVADPVQGLARLRAAVLAAGTVPVVAIGGITPDRAQDVYATGVRAVCAISSVNGAADVAAAARRFQPVVST